MAFAAILQSEASFLSEPFQGLTSLGAFSSVGGILVRLRTGFAIAIANNRHSHRHTIIIVIMISIMIFIIVGVTVCIILLSS